MSAHSFCHKCDGTGWIPYYSETVDGEIEEAYGLCPNCYAPRYCMGSTVGHPCFRPGTLRYGLGYYCKEHMISSHNGENSDKACETIYGLYGPAAPG
jgi:hypothetical protein